MGNKKDIKSIENIDYSTLESLYQNVKGVIERTRKTVYKTVNSETINGYWEIGKHIVDEEQKGKAKAEYGKYIIKNLSERLINDYGDTFSRRNLEYIRKFYLTFPIANSVSSQLSWTHYRNLLKVNSETGRAFYINEAIKGRWGTRTLERAILTKLYERTLLAQKDKQDVIELTQEIKSNEGEEDFTHEHFIKEPYNLSFTGLKHQSKYNEKDLEQALMDKLQDFILELGRGFAFVGRQYHITLEEEHFYVDMVFYNYILKCFLLIDLKTNKLTHGDLGQMQFYVGYFENEIRQSNDNPTIGLILCTDKNDKMVKYTLSESSKSIFASKYQLYLPSEEQLRKEIIEEKERLEMEKRINEIDS